MSATPTLSGELGLLSLFDLGQLLQLNGATGELCVTREGRRGYLYFDRGRIVNAVDDEYHEGAGAAYRVFAWKSGAFEFHARPATGARTVEEPTEALMLEAARRMDEQGAGGSAEAEKLQQRAGAFDDLREAFHSVALATGGRPAPAGAAASPLGALEGPDDALLLRPGGRARVRTRGAWRDAGDDPLDAESYERWRARLLAGSAAPGAAAGMTRFTGEDGRGYAVTPLAGGEGSLWITLDGVTPPDLASLPGGEVLALQFAGLTGLLVVGAPDPYAADRFFHACVARLAAARTDTLVLVAVPGRWAHADGGGALVAAGADEAARALGTCAPGCAAYDAAHAALSAAALGTASLVVAAVVAPDPAAAFAAWCARAGRVPGDGIETLLEPLGAAVAFASSARPDARLVLSPVEAAPRRRRAA